MPAVATPPRGFADRYAADEGPSLSPDHGIGKWGERRTAGDPTLESLDKLNDLSLWHVVENVPVFDEHEEDQEVIQKGPDGKPVMGPDGKPLKQTVHLVFDAAKLQEICDINNLREEATADVCPIMIGHTKKDTPEVELGEIVGYQRRYHVGPFGPAGKAAILTTWQIRPDKLELAREYPRRSIELWPNELIIDPVSILKRTPQRDLGILMYARKGPSLRYERTSNMADVEGAPSVNGDKAEEKPGEGTNLWDQVMKHKKLGPVMRYAAACHEALPEDEKAKYAAEEPAAAPEAPAAAAPVAAPEGGKSGEPVQADAMPSATNGTVPGQEEPIKNSGSDELRGKNQAAQVRAIWGKDPEGDYHPSQHSKQGQAMPADTVALQYAKRVEAENAQLKKRLDDMDRQTQTKECKAQLDRLHDEGFKVNYAKDVAAMLPLNAEGRQAYLAELREERARSEQSPMQYGRVPVNEDIADQRTAPASPHEPSSEREFAAALQYAREHPAECGGERGFSVALQAVRKPAPSLRNGVK